MTKKRTDLSKNFKASLKQQKIPLIPPLFHENKFVTNFKEKAELFNFHFATQCSLISNSSKLLSYIKYLTDNRLSLASFSHDKIAKVIQNLDPNKAHGHDNISIRMVKVCGPSIYKPLEIIFNQCLETGVFPSEWKKGNIFLFTKKGTNRCCKTTVQCRCYLYVGKFLKD